MLIRWWWLDDSSCITMLLLHSASSTLSPDTSFRYHLQPFRVFVRSRLQPGEIFKSICSFFPRSVLYPVHCENHPLCGAFIHRFLLFDVSFRYKCRLLLLLLSSVTCTHDACLHVGVYGDIPTLARRISSEIRKQPMMLTSWKYSLTKQNK